MFNGYNQPSYESDAVRENNLKKSAHTTPWNYPQSYYNNSDLQQTSSSGTWQQKLSYPNVAGKCACVQCQQGPWYHKEVEPVVPSSANPDMMLLGPGIGGGGGSDYSMETFPRPEAFMRNNVQVSKKFSSCSYPTPNPQMYSHRLPNIKPNVSEFTNFDRNSDQYMRMFEASSYGRKPADSRAKYWDSVNGAFYPPQQYHQYPPPCRYPPYNPPFYYPNSNQSQSYQHPQHPPQQNGIQQYYGIGPNTMRPMEVSQPIAHNYLKQESNSKISPLRLMRKKKLAESVGQPSPPRMAQVTDNAPALDVRRFLATWADEDEESPSVPQMVVLDCQDINAEQAELLRLYESSTSVRLVQEPCIEQDIRSEQDIIPSKITEEVVDVQSVVSDETLPSAVPAVHSKETIPAVSDVREAVIASQQPDESNGSPLPSPASTANSQDSLPDLADLPTSEYRKNKFLDYDQQSFPLLPAKPTENETMAVNSCRPQTVANPTEETERNEKKNNRKRSRKPTIKFSIQKSHDLKISLRVLNESQGDSEQDSNNKVIDRKDEGHERDLITVSLNEEEDDTQVHDMRQKRAKKLKRRRIMEQNYSVSSEEHCNDVTSDGFQVEESLDSAKIKLTFKRRKGEREPEEIPKKKKKAKRIKGDRDNKSKAASSDWKVTSPEGPPAADTTTDFYGQPPTHPSEQKLDTPLPSPTQLSITDIPNNVSTNPISNEHLIPTFSAFDQPDSSHENSGNKKTISQNSNTSSPKISSSCHITSPRTSTDSIERELQAIWSGRGNDVKYDEDERITSNVNVVDFYTEDISTGPINAVPIEQQSFEASSVSESCKNNAVPLDLIEKAPKGCIEESENYKQVVEIITDNIFRSPTKISGCDNYDNQGRNELESLNMPLTMSMASSPSSDILTIPNTVVDNFAVSPNLIWQGPALREISSICNKDGNDSLGNDSISNITYEDTNGPRKQVFENMSSDGSNDPADVLFDNSEIILEALEQPSIVNKITFSDTNSPTVDDIVTTNQNNVVVQEDNLHTCDENTIERSDNPESDTLKQITSTKVNDNCDFSQNLHCLKSPTQPFENKTEQPANEVCNTELLTKLSFDSISNENVNFDINDEMAKNKIKTFEPSMDVDRLAISCDNVLEVRKKRLGPRTPEGSPNLLNSYISPIYSGSCESPYSSYSHDYSDDAVYQSESTIDKKVHSSAKDLSLKNKNEENKSILSTDSIAINFLNPIHNVVEELETNSPMNLSDFKNETEENKIKSPINFKSSEEESGKISDTEPLDLDNRKIEIEVNALLYSTASNSSKDGDEISTSLDIINLNLKNEDIEVPTTEEEEKTKESGILSPNLNKTKEEFHVTSPVNSFESDNETKNDDLDLKSPLTSVDFNKTESKIPHNTSYNKINGCEMDSDDEFINKSNEHATNSTFDLNNTKEVGMVIPSPNPVDLNFSEDSSNATSIKLDTTEKHYDTQNPVDSNEKCAKLSSDSMHLADLQENFVSNCALSQETCINIPSDSIDFSGEKCQEQGKSPLSSLDLSHKSEECRIDFSLQSVPDQNEKLEYEATTSLNPVEKNLEDNIIEVFDPKSLKVMKCELEDLSKSINLKLTVCKEINDVSNYDPITEDLTSPTDPTAQKHADNANKTNQVSTVEDKTKKTCENGNADESLVLDENLFGDEDNLSENISKTFVTLTFISPLSSPNRVRDEIENNDDETNCEIGIKAVPITDRFNDDESMESVELEADENANIIIGVEETSDFHDGNSTEYFIENPNDDETLPDLLPSPFEKLDSDCTDVCTELNLQRYKIGENEMIEEDEEYIVVSDDYMCPIVMEDGEVVEISNEEDTSVSIKVEDIPLPLGDAPKENCFNYRKWLDENCNRDSLSINKNCVSPFTSEVLGMFRNPSPPGTPRMLMSPTSHTGNEIIRSTAITEVEENDEDDGLPGDAEFQHVMENCLANARKFLNGEIDEERANSRNDEPEENVSRKDVLLSSFETHSDLEIGCDPSSAEDGIAFSPFNTVIASETLPVDNWPYLEEEVPSSPQWPLVSEEDIPLLENEEHSVESNPPNIINTNFPPFAFEKESINSNHLPRIRRRTLDNGSNNKVRTRTFLSERERNESDNELIEEFRDFKCHVSLDRLALRLDKEGKAKTSWRRKKSLESEHPKCKSEDFKGGKWQPKVVLRRMSSDKQSLTKMTKNKTAGCFIKKPGLNQFQLLPEESKNVYRIENETFPSKKISPEPQLKKSHSFNSVIKTKVSSKPTLSYFKTKKCLSSQNNTNSIICESQTKSDLELVSQDQVKTQSNMKVESLQDEKKKYNEEKLNDSNLHVDIHKPNYISHKMKHGHSKVHKNETKFEVSDNKYGHGNIGQNKRFNNKIKMVSESSKKFKEERNHKVDQLESLVKKSSHKEKVLKNKINDNGRENSKKPIASSISNIDECKTDSYDTIQNTVESPTSCAGGKVNKFQASSMKPIGDIMNASNCLDGNNSDNCDPWVCAVCGFDDLNQQQKHIQEHAFHCQGCHLAFISEDHFIKHLSKKHEDIRKIHHCLLCELSFDTIESYNKHLETREHKHLEEVEKSTIHTLFTLFCGEPCPVLGPVTEKPEWLPNQAGTVHFYHQATPLALATQYWKQKQSSAVNKQ